jgi:hypothetical protein
MATKKDKYLPGKILVGGALALSAAALLITRGDKSRRREVAGKAVVGNDRGGYRVRPIIRVPVIDPDGNATNLQAVWAIPSDVNPDYFYESKGDDMWLFEDPNGRIYVDPETVNPGSPIAGRRFRPYYPASRPIFMGDRLTSRKPPTSTGAMSVGGLIDDVRSAIARTVGDRYVIVVLGFPIPSDPQQLRFGAESNDLAWLKRIVDQAPIAHVTGTWLIWDRAADRAVYVRCGCPSETPSSIPRSSAP